MEDSSLISKEKAAAAARELGMRPYFVNSEEADDIEELVRLTRAGVTMNADTLHTYMPPLDIRPPEVELSPADRYGFIRLSHYQNLVRAHLKNVSSCHTLYGGGGDAPSGQFAYLTNPNWSCFGVYTDPKSQAAYATDYLPLKDKYIKTLPNLIATVNVLLGFSAKGEPSVMLSRVYGNWKDPNMLLRLVDYFSYTQGMRVYVHEKWGRREKAINQGHNIPAESDHCYFTHLASREKTMWFFSPPVEAQIVTVDRRAIAHRYHDIDAPYVNVKGSGVILVGEYQPTVFWKSAKENPNGRAQRILVGMGSGERKKTREEMTNTFDHAGKFTTRLTTGAVMCAGCKGSQGALIKGSQNLVYYKGEYFHLQCRPPEYDAVEKPASEETVGEAEILLTPVEREEVAEALA